MNYETLNIKNLLIFSSLIAVFLSPVNASDSESDNYYGKDAFSFRDSKKEENNKKDNKKESNKYYRSKTYNLDKKYSDDYYNESEYSNNEGNLKQTKNRDLKTLYKKNKLDLPNNSNGHDDYNTYKSPEKGKYSQNSSDLSSDSYEMQNDGFDTPRFATQNKKDNKKCVGKDCNKNEPKFSSYVYSSSSSMVSNEDGTWIRQDKYDMAEDNNRKQERRQFSKGDSKSGVVKTKYKEIEIDKKTNKKFEQRDTWENNISDFIQGKHKKKTETKKINI